MSFNDPKPFGDPVAHSRLVQSMAKATGIDLTAAAAQGRLSKSDWVDVVQNCCGCAWERDGGCSKWLTIQEVGAADVPSLCANQESLQALKTDE